MISGSISELDFRIPAHNAGQLQKQPKLQLLTDAQEAALVDRCTELFCWGYPITYALLGGYFGQQKCRERWHLRFRDRHTELRASFTRRMENKHSKATHPAIILDYFIKYQEITAIFRKSWPATSARY